MKWISKRYRISAVISCLAFYIGFGQVSEACTDFLVKAKDGSIVVTRSMEFALDLKSNIRTSNRDRAFSMTLPDGKPAMQWKAKYGYVFLDGLGIDMAVDGMNEKGLSYGALYLPTLAQYQTVPAGKASQALSYLFVGDWILSNFATVAEVKAAIKNIYVYEQKLPQTGDVIFPIHYSIHDAAGNSLVVEYINGEMNIYDNAVNVLTNSPSYPWHVTNLVNYLHLAPTNPPAIVANGVTFAATGQGYGMIGLPGDISPPSRFVKTATLMHVAIPTNNVQEAINLGEHIINNVDIPLGLAREPSKGDPTNELTEWVVFKDLTHHFMLYRTYDNLTLRSVNLNNLDFSPQAPRLKMPIENGPYVQDLTQQFIQHKA